MTQAIRLCDIEVHGVELVLPTVTAASEEAESGVARQRSVTWCEPGSQARSHSSGVVSSTVRSSPMRQVPVARVRRHSTGAHGARWIAAGCRI